MNFSIKPSYLATISEISPKTFPMISFISCGVHLLRHGGITGHIFGHRMVHAALKLSDLNSLFQFVEQVFT